MNTAILDTDKVKGFDSINFNCFKDYDGNICKIHNVPYKIWHPTNDAFVDYNVSVEMVNRIKNAGGYAILRTMSDGGHSPETAGLAIGTFQYNNQTVNIYPAMQELKLWFDRFNY